MLNIGINYFVFTTGIQQALMCRLSTLLLLYQRVFHANETIYGAVACFCLTCRSFTVVLKTMEAASEISGRKCVIALMVWFVNLEDDSTSYVAA